MKRPSKALFLVMSIAVAVVMAGCSAAVEEPEPTPEPYEGEWHQCLMSQYGLWLKFESGKAYMAFTVYDNNDCLTGGGYSSLASWPSTTVPAIEYVADITTKSVTGAPEGYRVVTVTYVAGFGTTVGVGSMFTSFVGKPMDFVFYLDGTILRGLTIYSGSYQGSGEMSANHSTWDGWLTEPQVASFVADPAGYVSGAEFYKLALTPGAPTAAP